ncbi:hypothetical protein AB1Y20_022395 [Prymnesium parvum]|uniref:Uncharacterized protein n=1 Tax=Prymnesium parvum TaxID=97485 RepID=A0AB34JH12_PRYPA
MERIAEWLEEFFHSVPGDARAKVEPQSELKDTPDADEASPPWTRTPWNTIAPARELPPQVVQLMTRRGKNRGKPRADMVLACARLMRVAQAVPASCPMGRGPPGHRNQLHFTLNLASTSPELARGQHGRL